VCIVDIRWRLSNFINHNLAFCMTLLCLLMPLAHGKKQNINDNRLTVSNLPQKRLIISASARKNSTNFYGR
jgi:hypothetical protein